MDLVDVIQMRTLSDEGICVIITINKFMSSFVSACWYE